MKVAALAILLTSIHTGIASAQVVVDGPGAYSTYGDQTFGPNGAQSHYGNQTFAPDGTYSTYGTQTFGPNGTYSTYGNQTFGSDGSTATTYGDTTFIEGPNGSMTCSRYGTQAFCN